MKRGGSCLSRPAAWLHNRECPANSGVVWALDLRRKIDIDTKENKLYENLGFGNGSAGIQHIR